MPVPAIATLAESGFDGDRLTPLATGIAEQRSSDKLGSNRRYFVASSAGFVWTGAIPAFMFAPK
jgi:hypothetical protein